MKISEPNPNILHIEALRKKFVSDFDRDMLEGITLEQYAMRTGDKKNFYLECHHVIWIARGGADEVYNAVALCPNCHRKMHILDEKSDVDYLLKIAKEQ